MLFMFFGIEWRVSSVQKFTKVLMKYTQSNYSLSIYSLWVTTVQNVTISSPCFFNHHWLLVRGPPGMSTRGPSCLALRFQSLVLMSVPESKNRSSLPQNILQFYHWWNFLHTLLLSQSIYNIYTSIVQKINILIIRCLFIVHYHNSNFESSYRYTV